MSKVNHYPVKGHISLKKLSLNVRKESGFLCLHLTPRSWNINPTPTMRGWLPRAVPPHGECMVQAIMYLHDRRAQLGGTYEV